MYSTGFAYLLWLFSGFGVLGFHRFYLGKIPTGLLWLCTGGLFGIGAICDFFTLGNQVRMANYRAAITGNRRTGFHQYNNYGRAEPDGTTWRNVNDGETRVIHDTPKETPERAILRIAKNNSGIITPGDLALEADIPIDEAKKNLEALVTKGFAELRVRKTGTLVYVIPEFTDSGSPLEDF
jgi:TM2 domain-containing membrane protein YozV